MADWLHAPGKPTVLCYGHFDVQVRPILWNFGSRRHLNKRSAMEISTPHADRRDDKGQMFSPYQGDRSHQRRVYGRPPVNIKFLIEGEEEVGGLSWLRKYGNGYESGES